MSIPICPGPSATTGCRRPGRWLSLLLIALLATGSGGAAAEARREGGDSAVRKLEYMLRELSTENQSLKAENARLQGQLQDLKSENGKLTTELGANKTALSHNRKNNAMLVERVRSDSDRYRNLVEHYREKLKALRTTQFKVAYLEQAVKERNQWIDTCKANNDDLYKANSKLLDLYQHRGVLDVLTGADPVTGLARVRRESKVEDYRYKLEDLKMLDFRQTADRAPDDTAAAGTPH